MIHDIFMCAFFGIFMVFLCIQPQLQLQLQTIFKYIFINYCVGVIDVLFSFLWHNIIARQKNHEITGFLDLLTTNDLIVGVKPHHSKQKLSINLLNSLNPILTCLMVLITNCKLSN